MWSRLNGLSTRIINYTWMFAGGQMDIYVYIRKCANTGSQINSFSPIIRNEWKSKCKDIVQWCVHLFVYLALSTLCLFVNMNINTFSHLVICKAWLLFWYTHVFLNFLFLLIDYLIETFVERRDERMALSTLCLFVNMTNHMTLNVIITQCQAFVMSVL